MVQETNLGLNMNGACQALAYADAAKLIADIKTIKRNSHMLLTACKGIDSAVNTEKTKYKEGRHRGMMTNEHITVGSNPY